MRYTDQDPAPDPVLRIALDDVFPELPEQEVDWEALRRSVARAAEAPLARRRAQLEWRERARRWLRPTFPIAVTAAAATLAAILLLREPAAEIPALPPIEAMAPAEMQLAVEELLLQPELSDEEFGRLVTGRHEAANLLWFAVSHD